MRRATSKTWLTSALLAGLPGLTSSDELERAARAAEQRGKLRVFPEIHRMDEWEEELGHLASARAAGDEVRRLASRFAEEHQRIDERLSPFAEQDANTRSAPAPDNELRSLRALEGAAFDRLFLYDVIENDRALIRTLERARSAARDRDLAAILRRAIRVSKSHLSQAGYLERRAAQA